MYQVANVYKKYKKRTKMCIAALAAVCDDGISPVKIQKDPPLQFPGNIGVPEQDVVLMKEVNDSAVVLQNACTRAFEAGKGNLVEDVLSKLNIAIEAANQFWIANSVCSLFRGC